MVDIDVAILSKMERGERKLKKDIVSQLAKIYNHNADDLLILFRSDKLLYEIKDDELGAKALKVAEQKFEYLKRAKK